VNAQLNGAEIITCIFRLRESQQFRFCSQELAGLRVSPFSPSYFYTRLKNFGD
jgi:hypothetical protein